VSAEAKRPTSPGLARLREIAADPLRLEPVVWRLLCVFAFSIPFSIAVAESVLGLTAAVAIRHWWLCGRPRPRTPLDGPILAFLVTALLGALAGLDPARSLWGVRTYLQVIIVYLVYAHVRADEKRALELLGCFLAGMAVTSAYAVVVALSPWPLPRLFVGRMTRAGQLLFAVATAAALVLRRVLWPRLLPYLLALYTIAMLVSLKRGAWLGTAVAVAIVGWLRSRLLVGIVVVVPLLAVATIPPVRSRVENTLRDLYLPGNRYDIWRSAIDVIERFPMGVGRKNGMILRDYPNIPQNHKHAHNNLLQLAMENGYLGAAAFLWWMAAFGALSWRGLRSAPPDRPSAAVALAVFSTFVGFHCAGMVEYNFGDSEVLQVFFIMMGLGLALAAVTGHQSEGVVGAASRRKAAGHAATG
jgi:O-antigen ligase